MSNDNKKIILLKKLSPNSFIKIQDLINDKDKTIYELFNELKLSLSTSLKSSLIDINEIKSSLLDINEIKSNLININEIKSSLLDINEIKLNLSDINEIKSSLLDINEIKLSLSTINLLPIGSIIIYSGEYIPKDWLKCDGSQLLISDYTELYNVIGNIYGGNNLIFNLPDSQGKNIIGTSNKYELGKSGGEEVHLLTIDELPTHNFSGITDISGDHNHNGNTGLSGDHTHKGNSNINDYGLIHKSSGNNNTVNNLSLTNGIDLPDLLTKPLKLEINNSGEHNHSIINDGNHSHKFTTNSLGLNKSHNIMQPYIVMNYLIKYK